MAKATSNTVVETGNALPPAVVKPKSRAVHSKTRLFLYVRAAGRCEFDGCNCYLLEHHVTKQAGNFAEMAHIWAFSENGPRGDLAEAGTDIHDIENLMLLCPTCHKLVDTHRGMFTVEVLRSFKKAHEDRVFELTDTKPDRGTVAVVLRGRVAGKPVVVSLPEIQSAIAPRYCGDRCVHEIDLTAIEDSSSPAFWSIGETTIRKQMSRFYETPFDKQLTHHVSVFALAPIPLLMVLGSTLSDKVPTALFQRHRDSESWNWKSVGDAVSFETKRVQVGTHSDRVALVVSLSGVVSRSDLPSHIDDSYAIYAIEPINTKPNTGILDIEASLQAFRTTYQQTMRLIDSEHPSLKTVDLFPAVPAPAAVAMGRDLLPKRDPVLVVYDFDKANGGFVKTLEVNTHDRH